MGKKIRKLLKRAIQVKEQVSEPIVYKLGALKTSVLKSLLNKVASPKVCNSIKKRLQHSCFLVKFSNFQRTPYLQNSFSGYFRGLTRVLKEVQNKNQCDCQQ